MRNVAIIVAIALFLLLYLLPVVFKAGDLIIEDEVCFSLTAGSLIDHGTVYIRDINYRYNENYNTNIFGKKHISYVKGKGMVEQYPFGFPLFLAIFSFIFLGHIEFFVPVIGVLGGLLFYLLNRQYFNDKKQAFYAMVLLLSLPGYYYWSTFLMADILSVVLLVLSLLFLEIFISKKKTVFLFFGIMLLGINVWVKYTNLLIMLPVFVYLLLNREDWKSFQRTVFIGTVAFMIPIACLLLYHFYVFGNPLTTGYHAYDARFYKPVITAAASKPGVSLEHLLPMAVSKKYFLKHLFGLPLHMTVVMPYFCLGIISLFAMSRQNRGKFWFIITLLISSFMFYFNLGGTHGYDYEEMTMHSSYLRYLLQAVVFLTIPIALFICDLKVSAKIKNIMVSILVIFSLFNNFSSVLFDNIRLIDKKTIPKIRKVKDFILENVNEGGVIIASGRGKYILPERAVIRPDGINIDELLRVVRTLLEDGKEVFVVSDGGTNIDKKILKIAKVVTITNDVDTMYRILEFND